MSKNYIECKKLAKKYNIYLKQQRAFIEERKNEIVIRYPHCTIIFEDFAEVRHYLNILLKRK